MRKLNVHDDEIGFEATCVPDCLATVAHRLGLVAMRAEQVAEQPQVQFVVLDNQHPLGHRPPRTTMGSES